MGYSWHEGLIVLVSTAPTEEEKMMDFIRIMFFLPLCLPLCTAAQSTKISIAVEALTERNIPGIEIAPELSETVIHLEGMAVPAQELLGRLLSNAKSGYWGNLDMFTLKPLTEERGRLTFADRRLIVTCSLRLNRDDAPMAATIEECRYNELAVPYRLRGTFFDPPSR